MNTFENFGFTSVNDFTHRNHFSTNLVTHNENSISDFFGIQILNSMVSGIASRNSQSSITSKTKAGFSESSISSLKKQTEDDIKFMQECFQIGLKNQISLTKQSCNNIHKEREFQIFCEMWNNHFKINISSILYELSQLSYNQECITKPKLMIARTKPIITHQTTETKIDVRSAYELFCQDFKDDYLTNEYFDSNWINSWAKDCISPISDSINLHYIMQGLPTIIVFPVYRNNIISIEVAIWTYYPGKNNLCFNKLIQLDKEYASENQDCLQLAILAAATFVNDLYRAAFYGKDCDVLHHYNDLFSQYSPVHTQICKLYQQMKSNFSGSAFEVLLQNNISK